MNVKTLLTKIAEACVADPDNMLRDHIVDNTTPAQEHEAVKVLDAAYGDDDYAGLKGEDAGYACLLAAEAFA